jgi:AcrR family transcriptional regulator
MTSTNIPKVSSEPAAEERLSSVQRSRLRTLTQARLMLDAALRLIRVKGDEFTIQELAKEAGVALQTFYRYFASRDELLLAVIGNAMDEACERWAVAARELPDPVARMRFYIMSALGEREDQTDAMARFVVSSHWRLHRIFPDELSEAQRPFVDLFLTEINAGVEAGLLHPANPEWSAWFIAELARSVFYHYARVSKPGDDVQEQLWQFCLMALGGRDS